VASQNEFFLCCITSYECSHYNVSLPRSWTPQRERAPTNPRAPRLEGVVVRWTVSRTRKFVAPYVSISEPRGGADREAASCSAPRTSWATLPVCMRASCPRPDRQARYTPNAHEAGFVRWDLCRRNVSVLRGAHVSVSELALAQKVCLCTHFHACMNATMCNGAGVHAQTRV
jgi:hypothetical protein